MKICVTGTAKTGTTAVACMVKNALPNYEFSFEPPVRDIDSLLKNYDDIVVKSLIHTTGCLDNFDKRVFICRDPRDRIISALLYVSGYHSDIPAERAIKLLQRKESSNDLSFIYLHRELRPHCELSSSYLGGTVLLDMVKTFQKEYYLLKYEDFVDGKVKGLESYLGCSLNPTVDVGVYSRVARTKSYGNWRKWFKQSDVDILKPLMYPYLYYFGYDPDDWELSSDAIDPQYASEYVKRIRIEKSGNK